MSHSNASILKGLYAILKYSLNIAFNKSIHSFTKCSIFALDYNKYVPKLEFIMQIILTLKNNCILDFKIASGIMQIS